MPNYQKLFKSDFIDKLITDLRSGKTVNLYGKPAFEYQEENTLINKRITYNELPELTMPENGKFFEFENAVKLFNCYRSLNRTQATDKRMWTFMAHTQYWQYMLARWPLPESAVKRKVVTHILDHWFLDGSKAFSRHGVASLWWGAFITYDEKSKKPFELTEEFFSKQDYKRVILEENICFYKPLVHAILEYIVENKELFEKHWAPKVRFLIRKLNFISGYKILSSLPKQTIKNIVDEYSADIAGITYGEEAET